MIYAAFSVWLLGIIFLGMAVYSLLTRLTKPVVIHWALLPGTIVSEMAYIFGCLITGGEIRRAKIMPEGGEGKGDGAATEAEPKLKFVGPVIAAIIAIAACGAAIVAAHHYLGDPVIQKFEADPARIISAQLPKVLPTSMEAFWDQMEWQITLLHRTTNTWGRLNWTDWHVPLFVYLALCLAVRMAPAGRPMRATLAAVIILAGIIAGLGALSAKMSSAIQDLWPLLTYIWCTLLFLLVVVAIIHGIVGLVRAISGKSAGKSAGKPAK